MKYKKIMKKTMFSVLAVVMGLAVGMSLVFGIQGLCYSVNKSDFVGGEQIDYCYDYVDANNYKMIKPKGLYSNNSIWTIKEEEFYVDDFGKVYRIDCTQKGFGKTTVEKTEIKSQYENGTIITVISDKVICPCTTSECPHKALQKTVSEVYKFAPMNDKTGYKKIDYCYDYVDEGNYEVIESNKSQLLYLDDFGKVYVGKQSTSGLLDTEVEMTKLKSKHENGTIITVSSDGVFCHCKTSECPHQELKGKINNGS